MSSERPYYFLPTPLPLTSFAQQKFGMIELDPADGTAAVAHGDILIDDGCSFANMSTSNIPSLSFNGSSLNVSATSFVVNSDVVLNTSLNHSNVVPTSSSVVPWYQQGGLYLTSVTNSSGNTVHVLAVMP